MKPNTHEASVGPYTWGTPKVSRRIVTVFASADALAASPAAAPSSARAGASPAMMRLNPTRATNATEESDSEEERTRFTAAFLGWGERGIPGTDRLPIA